MSETPIYDAMVADPPEVLTCLCNIGAQACPLHPDHLWSKEQKIAFRKAWDERVTG